jgi:hypothetical protein
MTPARSARALTAALLCAVLAGCGSGGAGDAESAPEPPTQEELDSYVETTSADAEAIGEDLAAAYEQDKEFPDTLDGLGTLSEGNEIGSYEVTADRADLCVQHVVDGEGVVFSNYGVNVAGGVKFMRAGVSATGTSTGCV